MPKGKHLSTEIREQIHHHCIVNAMPVIQAHQLLFFGDNNVYSLASLKVLVSQLRNMSEDEILHFLGGPTPRKAVAGRKRIYDGSDAEKIIELRKTYHLSKLSSIAETFQKYYTEDNMNIPSKSTLSRLFRRANITHKVTTIKNVNADDQAQYEYLKFISAYNPEALVDVDETLCTQSEFERKYGWSPQGEEAHQYQLRIGTRTFSTIAAYTTVGFIAWAIYEGTVTHVEVEHFLVEYLQPVLSDRSMCILDNATVHKTESTQATLEAVCQGKYLYCPPYSPELKPIEKGFSLVKKYVRENENVALTDPIAYINNAFELYSIRGERGQTGTCYLFFTEILVYLF